MKTSNYTRKIAMIGIAAIGFATVAMTAQADEAPARTVRYADLNLNTSAGAAVLYKRIKNAAEQVCGDLNSRQLAEAAAAKACVQNGVYAGVRSVNNAQLTDEYNAHMGAARETISVASLR